MINLGATIAGLPNSQSSASLPLNQTSRYYSCPGTVSATPGKEQQRTNATVQVVVKPPLQSMQRCASRSCSSVREQQQETNYTLHTPRLQRRVATRRGCREQQQTNYTPRLPSLQKDTSSSFMPQLQRLVSYSPCLQRPVSRSCSPGREQQQQQQQTNYTIYMPPLQSSISKACLPGGEQQTNYTVCPRPLQVGTSEQPTTFRRDMSGYNTPQLQRPVSRSCSPGTEQQQQQQYSLCPSSAMSANGTVSPRPLQAVWSPLQRNRSGYNTPRLQRPVSPSYSPGRERQHYSSCPLNAMSATPGKEQLQQTSGTVTPQPLQAVWSPLQRNRSGYNTPRLQRPVSPSYSPAREQQQETNYTLYMPRLQMPVSKSCSPGREQQQLLQQQSSCTVCPPPLQVGVSEQSTSSQMDKSMSNVPHSQRPHTVYMPQVEQQPHTNYTVYTPRLHSRGDEQQQQTNYALYTPQLHSLVSDCSLRAKEQQHSMNIVATVFESQSDLTISEASTSSSLPRKNMFSQLPVQTVSHVEPPSLLSSALRPVESAFLISNHLENAAHCASEKAADEMASAPSVSVVHNSDDVLSEACSSYMQPESVASQSNDNELSSFSSWKDFVTPLTSEQPLQERVSKALPSLTSNSLSTEKNSNLSISVIELRVELTSNLKAELEDLQREYRYLAVENNLNLPIFDLSLLRTELGALLKAKLEELPSENVPLVVENTSTLIRLEVSKMKALLELLKSECLDAKDAYAAHVAYWEVSKLKVELEYFEQVFIFKAELEHFAEVSKSKASFERLRSECSVGLSTPSDSSPLSRGEDLDISRENSPDRQPSRLFSFLREGCHKIEKLLSKPSASDLQLATAMEFSERYQIGNHDEQLELEPITDELSIVECGHGDMDELMEGDSVFKYHLQESS